MLRMTPISTLFPYTTLFRSTSFMSPAPRQNEIFDVGSVNDYRTKCSWHRGNGIAGTLTTYSESDITDSERSEEHTSELQSRQYLVCRLLLEKKKSWSHRTWI